MKPGWYYPREWVLMDGMIMLGLGCLLTAAYGGCT